MQSHCSLRGLSHATTSPRYHGNLHSVKETSTLHPKDIWSGDVHVLIGVFPWWMRWYWKSLELDIAGKKGSNFGDARVARHANMRTGSTWYRGTILSTPPKIEIL